MYRSTNHLRPGLADFGQACGMAVLRTNLDAAPGLDVGLELLSRPGPNLRWNGVVEIQASHLEEGLLRPEGHMCRLSSMIIGGDHRGRQKWSEHFVLRGGLDRTPNGEVTARIPKRRLLITQGRLSR